MNILMALDRIHELVEFEMNHLMDYGCFSMSSFIHVRNVLNMCQEYCTDEFQSLLINDIIHDFSSNLYPELCSPSDNLYSAILEFNTGVFMTMGMIEAEI